MAWGRPMTAAQAAATIEWPDRLHWWIDSVGGFLVLTNSVIRIGQAGSADCDLPILGDISSFHAEFRRGESGIILAPHAETTVNGKTASGYLLKDGDRIRMRSVEMVFRQPIAWSTTARLDLTSGHRLPLSLDGVLLLGETCVLGPGRDAHVRTAWKRSIHVNWYRQSYWIRCGDPITIDGRQVEGYGPLLPTSEVRGEWGSFQWEPER